MNETDDTSLIANAILRAIDARTQQIASEEITKAQAEVERRVRSEIGRIATTIFTDVNFERFGRDLRITVQFPGGKEPGRG